MYRQYDQYERMAIVHQIEYCVGESHGSHHDMRWQLSEAHTAEQVWGHTREMVLGREERCGASPGRGREGPGRERRDRSD